MCLERVSTRKSIVVAKVFSPDSTGLLHEKLSSLSHGECEKRKENKRRLKGQT